MRNTHPREIQVYRTQNGREPFTEWFNAIRDTRNGLTQFEIQEHKAEFGPDLPLLNTVILVIIALLVVAFLNFVSMSAQAIVSILVK